MRVLFSSLFFLSLFLLSSCGSDATIYTAEPYTGEYQNIEKSLQSQLILANDGDTITLGEGRYSFSKSLIMSGKSNIVIQGAGMDRTFLSFAQQQEGAEGLRITDGSNITLRDFTVQDAKGDNVKVNDVVGLSIINVKSEWTGTPNEKNGAYALYPVMCTNVLIENSIAAGASDAGIYVGQSKNVIVRGCEAYNNVAGIEIENTINADVYNNKSHDNTGGILVFDLPGLSQLGRNVRVFENEVYDNNHSNFAPKGNIVGSVPQGTGMMVLASEAVELFDNEIRDNKTASIAIISYLFVEATSEGVEPASTESDLSAQTINNQFRDDNQYNPYNSAISIHHNQISNRFTLPSFENDIGYLLFFSFWFDKPEILFDGFVNPATETSKVLCLNDNDGGSFANLDAPNEFSNVSKDATAHDCTLESLPPVVFSIEKKADELE
jgi:parallel beta-helix repeat protein